MTDDTPIARLRRAGLLGALVDLLGTDDPDALHEVQDLLRWVRIPRGEILYRQGEPALDLHIVVSGRLRVVAENDRGDSAVVGEISRGETAGEMALLEGRTRTATVFAVRDTALLALDREGLETVLSRRPQLVLNVSRLVSERLRRTLRGAGAPTRYRSVAIVPHADPGDARDLAAALARVLGRMGTAAVVDAARAAREVPGGGEGLAAEAALDAFEFDNDCVLYVADGDEAWARRCVRQADAVLLVARFDDDPAPRGLERSLDLGGADGLHGPRREIVLLHGAGAAPPRGTSRWLAARTVDRHHHLRRGEGADVERLARFLAGRAVGLVLAGGGAPGFAHVGVVRALREAGVPIDAVGGTSIGAIVAAAIASGFDDAALVREMREAFLGPNPLGDYTVLPLVSLAKGRRMERRLKRHLGDGAVEDAWLPFFCVSADISANVPHVHRSGPLWKAVRTSASVPGVLPPVVHGNHLLIDGSSVNNLPVDVMRGEGVGRVVAVDLDLRVERELGYDEVPSPWIVLAGRFLPGVRRRPVPSLANIVMKSTMLAGAERAARERSSVDLYLSPAVRKIGLLRWSAFDAVVDIGYRYAVAALDRATISRLTEEVP